MIEHPVTQLREQLSAADAATLFWRKTALVAGLTAFVSSSLTALVLFIGIQHMGELLTYRERCVTDETATHLLSLTETLSDINNLSLLAYRQHIMALDRAIPHLHAAREARQNMWIVGGEEDERLPRKDLPSVQALEASLRFLPGEGEEEWRSLVVQEVQQCRPAAPQEER